MALALEGIGWGTAEHWMRMQASYDLAQEATEAGGRGRLIDMDGSKRPLIDWAALLPKVARRLFDEPRMKDGGGIWRYGSDESLEFMSVDHGAVTWSDHKAASGGDTLDPMKHVLLCDEVNAIRWLKD